MQTKATLAPEHRRIIAIEGLDATGKETVSKRVTEILKERGFSALQVSFPRYETPCGQVITEYLSGKFGDPTGISPFIASVPYSLDRMNFFKENPIYSEDGEYDFYVCDRLFFSNFIHQGSKLDKMEMLQLWLSIQLTPEFLSFDQANNFYETYFLKVPEKIRQDQMQKRLSEGVIADGHEANLSYQNKCRMFIEAFDSNIVWNAYNSGHLKLAKKFYHDRLVNVEVKHADTPDKIPEAVEKNAQTIVKLATRDIGQPYTSLKTNADLGTVTISVE